MIIAQTHIGMTELFDANEEVLVQEAITCLSDSEFRIVHDLFDGETIHNLPLLIKKLEAAKKQSLVASKCFSKIQECCNGCYAIKLRRK